MLHTDVEKSNQAIDNELTAILNIYEPNSIVYEFLKKKSNELQEEIVKL